MARISEDERRIASDALALHCGWVGHRKSLARWLFHCGPGRVFINDWLHASDVDPIAAYVSDVRDQWEYRAASFVAKHRRDVTRIVDWLLLSAKENAAWIADVDNLGRPKKLMKCGSIQRLAREADKFMPRAVEHVRFEQAVDDGYYLVRLLTTAALREEGEAMDNCLANGRCDRRLLSGLAYYSVRDAAGHSVATLEVDAGIVTRAEGPSNRPMRDDVAAIVQELAASRDWYMPPVLAVDGGYGPDALAVLRDLFPPAPRRP